jgi:hypothetical protein
LGEAGLLGGEPLYSLAGLQVVSRRLPGNCPGLDRSIVFSICLP